jgi:hypothetical protein
VEQTFLIERKNNYIARKKNYALRNKKESLGKIICGTNFLRIRGTKMKIIGNKTNIEEQKNF